MPSKPNRHILDLEWIYFSIFLPVCVFPTYMERPVVHLGSNFQRLLGEFTAKKTAMNMIRFLSFKAPGFSTIRGTLALLLCACRNRHPFGFVGCSGTITFDWCGHTGHTGLQVVLLQIHIWKTQIALRPSKIRTIIIIFKHGIHGNQVFLCGILLP